MKIAIMGAGAMGCMLGACLQEGGADVSLIVRREEVAERYRTEGIQLKSYTDPDLNFGPYPMKAFANVEGMEVQDAILYLVKGPDTQAALEQTMPIIGDDTKLITLQNGVGNTDILAQAVPKERIYYGCVNISAIMEAPGVLTGALFGDNNVCLGPLVSGEEQRGFGELVCGMLKEGGVGAVYMEHVDSEVWYKLLLNLTTNAPCGIVRLRGGEAFENSEFYDMCKDIMQEAIDVAQKLGVDIDLDHLMGHVVPNAVKNAICIAQARTDETQTERHPASGSAKFMRTPNAAA